MENGKETVLLYGRMASVMRENGRKIVHGARESWPIASMSTIKEISLKIADKDMEFT